MSELLVWTGTHPDEKKALEVGRSLRDHPIPNVTSDVANPEAVKLNLRFVDLNLMKAYPGDATSKLYEARRAVEILKKSQDFPYVIDIHDAGGGYGETTAVIDRARGVAPRVLAFLGALGVKNVVLSEGMGLHAHHPNAFVLEMGLDLSIERLRTSIGSLANDAPPLEPRTVADFTWFEFLESLHETHFHPDSLSTERFNDLRPFTEFPELTAIIGRKAYLMSWKSQLNKQGYWGELVTPSSPPDMSEWPTSI